MSLRFQQNNGAGAVALVSQQVVSVREISATTVGGTTSAITITTGLEIDALTDGMEFVFTPTATVVAALPTLSVDGLTARHIKGADGYSFSVYYDIQKNKPLRVRYSSSLDVFIIQSPPLQWEDAVFGHGRVKLQAASATALSLTQDDGQGLLMWNAATSAFRMVRLDTITVSNLFAGNSTYVDGVAGQNLANNQLYSIYAANTDPTNQNATRLEFWRTYTGVGVAAWGPIINEIGIYVKPTTAAGSTADNTRIYVGQIWAGAGTIANDIAPAAAMANRVYSHFAANRWKFGYQTTTVTSVISSAVLATQTTPSIGSITEGISDSPRFIARTVATADTSGATVSFRISISGTAFNGTAFNQTTRTYTAGVPYANCPVFLSASWESAPPIGFYTCKVDLAVSTGSCSFDTDILGTLSQ